jgi:hypothetical protein
MLSGQLSPDGLWVWDGAAWVPTTSPDGLWRWDGYRWVPLPPPPALFMAVEPAPPRATVRTLLMAGLAVVLVAAVAVAGIAASGNHSRALPSATVTRLYPGAPAGTQVFDVPTRSHTTAHVAYPQTPPVGGLHAPIWLNCGIYDQPVPAENAVHSLEHGVVWITYDPARLDSSQLDILRGLVAAHYRGADRYIILSPYPGLPAPVVASAWGVQLRAQRVNDPAISEFVDYFLEGPETPELGGRCSGGEGDPIDGNGGPVT